MADRDYLGSRFVILVLSRSWPQHLKLRIAFYCIVMENFENTATTCTKAIEQGVELRESLSYSRSEGVAGKSIGFQGKENPVVAPLVQEVLFNVQELSRGEVRREGQRISVAVQSL